MSAEAQVRSAGVDPYDHANAIFLEALEQVGGTPKLLDVGCWNGGFGRALLARRRAIIDGIEKDAEQAAVARTAGYREVTVADLDTTRLTTSTERYDFVLFGDVLEHLRQPEIVLASARKLASDGRVLVSVPNIAYVGCRLKLLAGHWEYKDYGILDRTHLRFFTAKSLRNFALSCGFEVQWLRGYVGLRGYPWFIRQPARAAGRIWPSMFAIQLVACLRLS